MQPILRLMHISDLHCAPRTKGADVQARTVVGAILSRIAAFVGISDRISAGAVGHDSLAWRQLRRSIVAEARADGSWAEKTYLVATGDLTSWGDPGSLRPALALVKTIARDAGIPKYVIYGNHDVWPAQPLDPAGFPLFRSTRTLDAHRAQLRGGAPFAGDFPFCPLVSQPVPGTSKRLTVYAINTVRHGHLENAIAEGKVENDRYWESTGGLAPQLEVLGRQLGRDEIGVVLTHHPVFDPFNRKWRFVPWYKPMLLANDKDVGVALAGTNSVMRPLAHAVISGHTHKSFPDVGGHPPPPHGHLGADRYQFIGGTASQNFTRWDPSERPDPHSWEALGFLWDDDTRRIWVERILFERPANSAPFEPVSSTSDPDETADFFQLGP